METKSFQNYLNIENILFILFAIFPAAILSGNLIINIFIILISTFFLFFLTIKKIYFNYKNKIFIILILFFLSLIINLIFSKDIILSFPRVIKIFFIIFFVISFDYLVKNNEKKIYKLFNSWSLIFIIVTFDLIFEYFNGSNILGMKSFAPNLRLGSFTGIESNIGNYYYGFSLFFLAYIYNLYPKKILLNFLLAIFLIFISFLIGERSNFIKTFIVISLFCFLIYDLKLRSKLISLILIFALIFGVISSDQKMKTRYYGQFLKPILDNGLSYYLNNSIYGAHYLVAIEIFKKNPVFGVGIKNFRNESFREEYNISHIYNNKRGNTHPHQVHFEFLSETGLFGYVSFLIFVLSSLIFSIKSYLKNRNIFQLCAILFVGSSILPLIPMGSFFTTYTSSIFWINYSIMISFINQRLKF